MIKINNWEELNKVESSKDEYWLEIDLEDGYGWIVDSLDRSNDKYLSTHTFYGGETTKEYNKLLIECGFDVELIPWE